MFDDAKNDQNQRGLYSKRESELLPMMDFKS